MALATTLSPIAGDFIGLRGRTWIVEAVDAGRNNMVGLICVDDDAQGDRLDVDLAAKIDVRPLGDEWPR